ncbi:MAG TPA: hypothetical protein VFX43_13465 [Chitinophagaceae bacterium]|nr:hypothetical protein [Chitinophagaceae bacterium]
MDRKLLFFISKWIEDPAECTKQMSGKKRSLVFKAFIRVYWVEDIRLAVFIISLTAINAGIPGCSALWGFYLTLMQG